MHHLLICSGCHGAEKAADLAERLTNALPGFTVSGVECMGGCARPGTLAFRAEGKASYLFGDIEPQAEIADIVAFAQAYQAAPDGWITDARSFGQLRHGAIARIPVAPDR